MKRFNRFMKSPKTTVVAFGLAVALLLFSSIGGTRAALTYFSETYASRVQMSNIGVTLMEKGEDGKVREVSKRDYSSSSNGDWTESTGTLLEGMLGKGEELKLGKKYKEELSVRNTGNIDQYVRVNIYKYWVEGNKKDGEEADKIVNLDPGLIELNLVNTSDQGGDWLIDGEASTKERTVLYYSKLLPADSETTPFTDTLKIDNIIATKVTQEVVEEDGYKKITTIYDYDGVRFCIEANVDAVQDHNAEDAIWSAWGRRVSVNDGILSLVDSQSQD